MKQIEDSDFNLIVEATNKYKHLNQTIDGYVFEVVDTLDKFKSLAKRMENAVLFYTLLVSEGKYLVLTITSPDGNDFTNFGLKINDSKLSMDDDVKLRVYRNNFAPLHVEGVYKKFAQINNIE